MVELVISPRDVHIAAERIAPFVKATPVLTSERLNEMADAKLFFKCENFQNIGAFKARGAHNAVFSLTDFEAKYGVATHSSGNHATALCMAANNRGISAHIVMPYNSSKAKIASVERLGGFIEFCEPSIAAREEAIAKIVAQTGAHAVHPYNDPDVIAGQATAALEFINECPELDALLAAVGGGGLMSGCALIAKSLKPDIFTCGAEPEEVDDAYRSWTSKQLQSNSTTNTIADGLRGQLGQMAFDILNVHLDEFLTVSEVQIIEAMQLVWSEMKIIIEPSSAVPLAAVLAHRSKIKGDRIGIILSGGNVDLIALPW